MDIKAEYRKVVLRKILFISLCIIGIILFVGLFSVNTYESVSLKETYEIIWNHILGNEYEKRSQMWWADLYIWNRAVPRMLCAITIGAALAVAGSVMQSLMNNPLADPYTTGISSGACFGAVAAIVAGLTFSTASGEMGIVVNAFIGAMVPAVIVVLISTKINPSPATIILIGVAISYFFNSAVTYMMITTDADTLQAAYLWQVGSLSDITWSSVPLIVAVTAVGTVLMMLVSRHLNVMTLGDDNAKSLGLDVSKFRILCLMTLAIIIAAAVSHTGIIGFVGLISPHIVRLVMGSDNRFVIPASMAVGSLFLLVADYLAMLMTKAHDIPVGIVMGVIGSPIFLALIILQKKGYGGMY